MPIIPPFLTYLPNVKASFWSWQRHPFVDETLAREIQGQKMLIFNQCHFLLNFSLPLTFYFVCSIFDFLLFIKMQHCNLKIISWIKHSLHCQSLSMPIHSYLVYHGLTLRYTGLWLWTIGMLHIGIESIDNQISLPLGVWVSDMYREM